MAPIEHAESLLDEVITFDDDRCFRRLAPITDFRKDRDEARILFLCSREMNDQATNASHQELEQQQEYVMKVKFQYITVFIPAAIAFVTACPIKLSDFGAD